MPIIEFDNASFTYDGATFALDELSLRIEPGEFVCVLGGNGSGKSTLAKHVNALLTPDRGEVRTLGRDTRDTSAVYFIRSNAGLVFQNPDDQIVASIIEDDVAFGPENLGIPADELRERVKRALEQVGLQGFEERETAALSGGQKQRVAIAGVLAMEPQVVVFDEASSMLDPRGRAGLMRVCRELNEAGLTIVLITHYMEEAARADRVVVLESGKVVLDGAPTDVLTHVERLRSLHLDIPFAAHLSAELQARGLDVPLCVTEEELERALGCDARADLSPHGAEPSSPLDGIPFDGEANPPHDTSPSHDDPAMRSNGGSVPAPHPTPLLDIDGVSFTYEPESRKKKRADAAPADWGNDPNERWALRDVSIDIAAGEFFGIAGHTGSGKSTLIQIAAGLLKPATGSVKLADESGFVGVVFQYPERQLFAATVADDVAFGPRNLGLSSEEVDARVRKALELVHLDYDEIAAKSPFALSGGQQRRVAFAGVLAMEPHVLILDEPTAGLDPQARADLLGLVEELHDERGLTVVLVSHNMDDLARLCDRIAILNQGRLVAMGTPAQAFADEQSLHRIGLAVPHTLHLARALGLPTGNAIPSPAELADDIAKLVRDEG